MKIGVFTDMHLGNKQYGLLEREKDFYDQYLKAIDMFINADVDCVICAGDIFDKPRPSPQTLKVFIEGIRKLEQNDIRFFNIIGNHSIVQSNNFITPDEILEEVFPNESYTILDEENYCDGDVFICGLPYHFQFETDKLIERVGSLNQIAQDSDAHLKILVLHQSFKEYNGFPGEEFSINDIDISNFDLVICGHIHMSILTNINDSQVYLGPGSIERSSVAEARDEENQGKGIFLFDSEDFSINSINFVRIKSDRKFFIADGYINSEKDIEDLQNEIMQGIDGYKEKPILFLTVHDKTGSYMKLIDMTKDINDSCLTVNFNYIDENVQENYIDITSADMPTPQDVLKIALNPLDEKEVKLGLDVYEVLKNDGDAKKLLDDFLKERRESKRKQEQKNDEFYDQELEELIKYFDEQEE